MARSAKIAICIVTLLAVFGCGTWLGYSLPRGDGGNTAAPPGLSADPQDQIETLFTPYDNGLARYLKFLDTAKKSVFIACYGFTEPSIVDKLIELKTERNVNVRIVLDRSQSGGKYQKEAIERLRAAGIEVVIGTSPKYGAIMHNKFTIIDGLWVEDGSWNYSASASKQGNVMNFIRSPRRAQLFGDYWQKLYAHMSTQPQKLP